MNRERKELYSKLEELRNSKVLVYITGDRQGLETQIHPEVLDFFVDHLDNFGKTKKITLYLYTRGGSTSAAWSIPNLIKQFCDEFEVIIPFKAHSAGTLISLGASKIIMTKQATLGPIDPSVNTALNPQIPGAPPETRAPVSVEAINGYIELAKKEFNLKKGRELYNVLLTLSEKVHPLVLGEVVRARSQIKMLAERLLSDHLKDQNKIEKIIKFLSSESGSHDYTINREEAKNNLGLPIEKPDDELYRVIKLIYEDIRSELKLNEKLNPEMELGGNNEIEYIYRRALIESLHHGTHVFITKGKFIRQNLQIINQQSFEGWKYENIEE